MPNTSEYNAKYYRKHKERISKWKHEYYLTHKLDYDRRYKEFVARRKAKQGKLRKATRPAAKAVQA